MQIHLIEGQFVLTDRGYTPLEALWVQFVGENPPMVAGYDTSARVFKWTELRNIERRHGSFDAITVMTDVFQVSGLPEHKVWFMDGETAKSKSVRMEEVFGRSGQFMGIHPVLSGDCPGYLVGPGCWYRQSYPGFVYSLDVEGGLVFTRSASREAGVWSGAFPV